ncbi:hypothetical protein JL100_010505 [Skermanella mucosa]|uniref:hypothetical protein n=1 Tax=Skermanella mucosa TaxID=1789672 RepID=UPI00192B9C9C|nr:hypothetical protein [Skermanella mucosa]UEM23098.1 hypothetical protein JL100_010265 [Skermanella mucosa]UEM23144.1 hypothetical protein JL100_010505 [Skermanella mucosa]
MDVKLLRHLLTMHKHKAVVDAENTALRTEVESRSHITRIDVRTCWIDKLSSSAGRVPGQYSIAPGRVWWSGGNCYRTFIVGCDDLAVLTLARLRWHCVPGGKIGFEFPQD